MKQPLRPRTAIGLPASLQEQLNMYVLAGSDASVLVAITLNDQGQDV
jgi:hypothetical protein